MHTWTTITTMQLDRHIRLDFAEQHGKTVGWVVRRASDVYQAYRLPECDDSADFEVVDLLNDGELIGVADNERDAKDLVTGHVPEGADVIDLATYRKLRAEATESLPGADS